MEYFDDTLENYTDSDFIALVGHKYGWSVEEQCKKVLEGEPYAKQNGNALKYIAEFAKQKNEMLLFDSLKSYLNRNTLVIK